MKAILVVDMPNSCDECPIRFSGEPNEWCWVVKHGIDDVEERPSWCPLKPMPKKFNDDVYEEWMMFEEIEE